jgi:hypothetical protein
MPRTRKELEESYSRAAAFHGASAASAINRLFETAPGPHDTPDFVEQLAIAYAMKAAHCARIVLGDAPVPDQAGADDAEQVGGAELVRCEVCGRFREGLICNECYKTLSRQRTSENASTAPRTSRSAPRSERP